MQVQTINIALPKQLVRKVDEAAKTEYRNRSELIREALRVYLKENQEWEKLFAYGKSKSRKMGIRDQKDVDKVVYDARHKKSYR